MEDCHKLLNTDIMKIWGYYSTFTAALYAIVGWCHKNTIFLLVKNGFYAKINAKVIVKMNLFSRFGAIVALHFVGQKHDGKRMTHNHWLKRMA